MLWNINGRVRVVIVLVGVIFWPAEIACAGLHASRPSQDDEDWGEFSEFVQGAGEVAESEEHAITPTVFSTTEPSRLFGRGGAHEPNPEAGSLPEPQEAVPDVPPVAEDITIVEPAPPVPPVPEMIPGTESVESLKDLEDHDRLMDLSKLAEEPFRNYRTGESSWSWIPGSGSDFGWFSMQNSWYQKRGETSGMGALINIHWLGGPLSAPLPPRLYDFALGFQTRKSVSHRFSYDLAGSIGVYSDFEDSARDGVRLPSHAVGMLHVDQSTDLVFGVDYLDRNDYALLPVFGVSLHNLDVPGLRLDLIFPRPRVEYALSDSSRVYLRGEMGGGSWDIEFPDESDHVMTYRDYRLLFGLEQSNDADSFGALELGYVFNRSLEFKNVPGTTTFDDAFVIQWVHRH